MSRSARHRGVAITYIETPEVQDFGSIKMASLLLPGMRRFV
jgi:hypothetical protein